MLLMSPRFANHLELAGTPISGREDYLALDPYEVASRLSYTFWQTLPDDALLAAAADGSLATDAGFDTQLDRVFADPRTRDTVWQFWNEWMRFESFTGFSAERPAFMALAAGENLGVAGHDHWGDMVREIHDLTDLYTWTQAGTFPDLMTSDLSVTRSADLAHVYGVSAWSEAATIRASPTAAGAGSSSARRCWCPASRRRTRSTAALSSAARSCATASRSPTRTACRPGRWIRRRPARR